MKNPRSARFAAMGLVSVVCGLTAGSNSVEKCVQPGVQVSEPESRQSHLQGRPRAHRIPGHRGSCSLVLWSGKRMIGHPEHGANCHQAKVRQRRTHFGGTQAEFVLSRLKRPSLWASRRLGLLSSSLPEPDSPNIDVKENLNESS